jgi:hypothetical protein
MHFANSPNGVQSKFSVEMIFDPVGSAFGMDVKTVMVGYGDGVAGIWMEDEAVGDSEFVP